jgi:hypothetical protein
MRVVVDERYLALLDTVLYVEELAMSVQLTIWTHCLAIEIWI